MIPITPSGIRMRPTRSPFGRTARLLDAPTGSGSAATSRRPASMSRHFAPASSRRFTSGAAMPFARASARSSRVGGEDALARGLEPLRGAQQPRVLLRACESSAVRSERARAPGSRDS